MKRLRLQNLICTLLLVIPSTIVAQCPAGSCTTGNYASAVVAAEWNVGADWCQCVAGTWTTTLSPPGVTNDVLIQDGHVMTIGVLVSAECNNMTIEDGGQVTMEVDILQQNDLTLHGNWTNLGTFELDILDISLSWLLDGTSIIYFEGGNKHEMRSDGTDGNDEHLFNVSIGDEDTLVLLDISASNDLKLENDLSFGSSALDIGYVVLNDNDLIVDSDITNASTFSGTNETKYVVTNSTGTLRRAGVGDDADSATFPIGYDYGAFSPVTVNNSGTVDTFSVRCCNEINTSGTCGTTNIANRAVKVTWFIDEATSGGSSASLGFRFLNADKLTHPFDIWKVNHYDGGWDFAPNEGGKGGTSVNSSTYLRTSSTTLSAFSPWGMSSEGVLPVKLTHFYGEVGILPQLFWGTAGEVNSDHFVIERSTTGAGFKAVGVLAAQGYTTDVFRYTWTDHAPLDGRAYYRLKQVDADGHVEYSEVVALDFEITDYTLSPTVTSGFISITGGNSEEQWEILDMAGRIYGTFAVTPGALVDVSALPAGLFYVREQTSGRTLGFVRE